MYKKIVLIILGALIFMSCERKSAGESKIVIQLPKFFQKSDQVNTLASGNPPSALSEIDCFGFMVGGPDTGLKQNVCDVLNGATGAKVEDLFFGLIYGGYYSGTQAEFSVPSGSDRVITAVGFKTHMTAATGAEQACKDLLKTDPSGFSKAFIISKVAQVKVEPGLTTTVNMPMTYTMNSTNFVGDCLGPAAPGTGTTETPAGPPVKMRMRLQDNLTSVIAQTCVAVAFELLDANGNLAHVTEDMAFTVLEANNYQRFDGVGEYCTTAGQINPNIVFYDGSGRFSRVVMFLRVTTSTTANFTLNQEAGTTVIKEPVTGLTVYPSPGGSPSSDYEFTYNVFDVNSFRSSKSTTASTPIYVKPGECYPAIVQLLDNAGRPLRPYNNSMISGNNLDTIVSSIASVAGLVQLSATPMTCASPSSINMDSIPFNGTPGSIFGFNKFYYQVPSGNSGANFNFKVDSSGLGFYDASHSIFNLNPAAAVNNKSFWKIK